MIRTMDPEVQRAQSIFKTLCNKNRIEIIQRLSKRDSYVGELAAYASLKSSKVSKQLAYLKKYRYVTNYKKGLRTYYHLENKSLPGLIKYVINSPYLYNPSS